MNNTNIYTVIDMPGEIIRKGQEEIRAVFEGITQMIKELTQPMKELFDYVLLKMGGEKIGEDVARFYKSLVSNGVPEELAEKMTMRYLEERLRVFGKMIERTGYFPSLLSGKSPTITLKKEEKEKKEE